MKVYILNLLKEIQNWCGSPMVSKDPGSVTIYLCNLDLIISNFKMPSLSYGGHCSSSHHIKCLGSRREGKKQGQKKKGASL